MVRYALNTHAHDSYTHTHVARAVIILEEAAYCDPGLIAEVVVPLLSMQQSVLLCISTILDSGNHYTKMMELQDDLGKKVFETISITLVSTAKPR